MKLTVIHPIKKNQENSATTGRKKPSGAAAINAPHPPTSVSIKGTTNTTDTVSITNCNTSVIKTAQRPPAKVMTMTTKQMKIEVRGTDKYPVAGSAKKCPSDRGIKVQIILDRAYTAPPVLNKVSDPLNQV